jgi:Flp pilus assembly protein TadD
MKQAPSRPAAESPVKGRRLAAAGLAAALVTAILIVFLPAMDFAFIYYDDDRQILDNPFVKQLSLENVSWVFTHFCITSYYPVRLLSYAVDYHFWGANPQGYRLTNTAIHAANVLLLFWLLVRLGRGAREAGRGDPQVALTRVAGLEPAAEAAGDPVTASPAASAAGSGVRRAEAAGTRAAVLWRLGAAGAAAGILAVHPVVVEPVVWIPGREELLMTFFALACVHFHIWARRAADGGEGLRRVGVLHLLAAVACAMACLCNVVGAVIPFLVVAYDVAVIRMRRIRPILTGTGFLWAIAAGTIVLKQVGEPGDNPSSPLVTIGHLAISQRAAVVFNGFRQNLTSLVWPADLSLQYPHVVPASLFSFGPLLGLAFLLAMVPVLWCVRRRPLALWGLSWFLLALLPTAQIIPHHIFRADRFLYLPLVGLTVAAASGLGRLVERSRLGRVLLAVPVAVLVVFGVVSSRYLPVWRDPVTLFGYCVALTPDNAEAHNGLGVALVHVGDHTRAVEHYRRAIALVPEYVQAQSNLGSCLLRQGKLDEAIQHLQTAVALNPQHAESHANLGVALMRKGQLAEAQRHLEIARDLTPFLYEVYDNLGVVLVREGKYREAQAYHEQALRLNPDSDEAHFNRATALLYQGRLDEALREFETTFLLNPKHAQACSNYGVALLRAGRVAEAVRSLQEAVRLNPQYDDAYNNLGYALALQGDFRAAASAYEQALRISPGYVRAMNNLARLLATCPDAAVRNGPRAVQLAEQANQMAQGRDFEFLDVLAAAYAEAGRFDDAVAAAQQAIAVATANGRSDLAAGAQAHLEGYRRHEPLRENLPGKP